MDVGKKIKYYRKQHGYTQRELAEKCGLAVGTIQQYELGKREPRMGILQKISVVLDVNINQLLGHTSYSPFPYSDGTTWEMVEELPWDETHVFPNEIELIISFRSLNSLGQVKAIERVKELKEIKRYTEPECVKNKNGEYVPLFELHKDNEDS